MNDLKLKRFLDDKLDQTFIYSTMLHKAERFNNHMKMRFKMPIILTSSSLSIINSNFDGETMKIVNIIFNILTSVLLSMTSAWQFEARENEFRSSKQKFIKLSCEIEGKLLSSEKIDPSYVNNVIERYNSIEENLDYEIPSFIMSSTRERYKGEKTLPIIINGVAKEEIHRPDYISMNCSHLAVISEENV